MSAEILDEYQAFIKRKGSEDICAGFEPSSLGDQLFDFQASIVEWAMELWSNPGDLVFSPFTGIGSEGYVSVEMGRRFVGAELKRSYWELAKRNLSQAREIKSAGLFNEEELEAA